MKKYIYLSLVSLLLVVSSCTMSYKMNGTSIDYTKTKTISIKDFRNLAPLVNPSFAPVFNESLRDIFTKQTKLRPVKVNGDLQIEGEITGYEITPMSIQSNAIAAETRITATIKVRFTNKANPSKNFEKTMSAFQNYSNTKTLTAVQDEICQLIINELTETIYNQTVADW
ncbi:MAG: LptE family protein [Paludibacteraceae bacterium]|nr:LptE family protein [Paludibacteraceae bacterium]